MATEIERKFLVVGEEWKLNTTPTLYRQGYLNSHSERTVRVRIVDTQAFLTIKSKNTGIIRQEFEYPIPLADANQLLALCETPPLEKYRYRIVIHQHIWEVDEFIGVNKGLVVAEIELSNEHESFLKPQWCGKEVSTDNRYYNSQLTLHPYSTWSNNPSA